MKIIKKGEFSGNVRAEYPYFEDENLKDAAARMNNFSNRLMSEVKDYCKTLPSGRLYIVSYEARQEGESIFADFLLRLRNRGEGSESKSFSVEWRDGYIVKFGGNSGRGA